MAYAPQQLLEYYNNYKDQYIVFNTNVIENLSLLAQKTTLKCVNDNFPCILYITSMIDAKILIQISTAFFEQLKKANSKVSLRLSFRHPDTSKEITFYIHAKVTTYNKYQGNKPDLFFFTLSFLTKPPDDFIDIIGRYINKQTEKEKRIYERIVVRDKNQARMGIQSIEAFLFLDGNAKKCILTEISIFSAKIVIHGTPTEYYNKRIILLMKIDALKEMGEMVGVVERSEEVSKEKGLISLIINFDQDAIPPRYKMWIGECIEIVKLNRKPSGDSPIDTPFPH
ncbi:MAG: hypothetical protein JW881_13030 [Spirochaetales bacterium]|nr:hypothetical protein [Spirochaetales bacterium]